MKYGEQRETDRKEEKSPKIKQRERAKMRDKESEDEGESEDWRERERVEDKGEREGEQRSYLPNPSARAGYDTRSIFKWSLTGLNLVFFLLD